MNFWFQTEKKRANIQNSSHYLKCDAGSSYKVVMNFLISSTDVVGYVTF